MSLNISRSQDYPLIRGILTRPESFIRMRNDSAPSREALEVGPISGVEYLIATEGERPVALFLLCGDELHFCPVPETWGNTERIGHAFLEWTWRETALPQLVARIPAYNRTMVKLAKAVGFREVPGDSSTVEKRGKRYELLNLIIPRPPCFNS